MAPLTLEKRWQRIESLLNELKERQQAELFALGRRVVPSLTPEDLLQPNDYPELENHPHFRYEEGVLAGVLTVEMSLRVLRAELFDDSF